MAPRTIANAEEDSRMEAQVGMLLRVGVLSSAAVILFGGVLFLAHHGRSVVDFTVFRGTEPELRHPGSILLHALHGDDLAIIQCGILMLIATPVAVSHSPFSSSSTSTTTSTSPSRQWCCLSCSTALSGSIEK